MSDLRTPPAPGLSWEPAGHWWRRPLAFRLRTAALAVCAASLGLSAGASAQRPERISVRIRVVDATTGVPLGAAVVELEAAGMRAAAVADSAGGLRLSQIPPGVYSFRASRIGYMSLDTVLTLAATEADITLALRVQPIPLRPLTARAEQAGGGAAAERALFEREVAPSVIGVSRRELREIPALAEPDVLRSLQALPGVVAVNDLSAQLHVRGGGPDQNVYLLDGARIFAPYHMFGMFGAFNADAVGRVEFFRGALPARYGGALSSVVALEQEGVAGDTTRFEGGLSLLDARLMGSGALPAADGQWLLAARRTHADVVAATLLDDDFPYAFHDVQGWLSLAPASRHRLRASFFTSADRFEMFLRGGGTDLRARWRNAAGSTHWSWAGGGRWSAAGTLWASGYNGALEVGTGPTLRPTRSRVAAGGLRLEATRRAANLGLRFGLDAEVVQAALIGSEEPDGYIQGQQRASAAVAAIYAEAEWWIGAVRLAPGLRAAYEGSARRWPAEPRLAARVHLAEGLSLTIGAGRTHQVLSTVRDDRYILPGPPFWLLRAADAPGSTADGVDVVLDGWRGRGWRFYAGAFARRFEGVPRWRPEGTRELSRLAYDDGRARGLELVLRHHEGRWTGWLAYNLSRVRFDDSAGTSYSAAWDRRHAVDLALFRQFGDRLSLSSRMTYGSGLPFWPIVGFMHTTRLVPLRPEGDKPLERINIYDNDVPVWSRKQERLPSHFRVDLAARYRVRVGPFEITPYASIMNVTAYRNVLYYELRTPPASGNPLEADRTTELVPVEPLPLVVFPSLGVDVRF